MDPYRTRDTLAQALTDAVAEAAIKAAILAGCVGLTVACAFALIARRTRG